MNPVAPVTKALFIALLSPSDMSSRFLWVISAFTHSALINLGINEGWTSSAIKTPGSTQLLTILFGKSQAVHEQSLLMPPPKG